VSSDLLTRLALPGSPRVLALVRIVVCAHVASVLMSPSFDAILFVPAHVMPWAKTILPEALERLVLAHLGFVVQLGLAGALLGLLGLFTRPALLITFGSFFLSQDIWFRMSLFHDDWLYFNAYLLVLALSPCADAWSLDARLFGRDTTPRVSHRIALELMTLWFAGIYVAAGLAKLFPLVKAWPWLAGRRAQQFALEFLLDSPLTWVLGRPPFDYASTRWPFALAAVYTVCTELGAATLVLTTRHRARVLTSIAVMHAGVWLLGVPGFVQVACVAMTVFVPAAWLGD
jgi:hypothetical protein